MGVAAVGRDRCCIKHSCVSLQLKHRRVNAAVEMETCSGAATRQPQGVCSVHGCGCGAPWLASLPPRELRWRTARALARRRFIAPFKCFCTNFFVLFFIFVPIAATYPMQTYDYTLLRCSAAPDRQKLGYGAAPAFGCFRPVIAILPRVHNYVFNTTEMHLSWLLAGVTSQLSAITCPWIAPACICSVWRRTRPQRRSRLANTAHALVGAINCIRLQRALRVTALRNLTQVK